MLASARITEFIKGWESCSLTPYRDGGGLWTIGWGHLMTGEPHRAITQDFADLQLDDDLRKKSTTVDHLLLQNILQNRFDAMVSLVFNIGLTAFAGSTLLKRVNAGYWTEASAQFPLWNKITVQGVLTISKGLVKRRLAERAVFDHADYSGRP